MTTALAPSIAMMHLFLAPVKCTRP